MWFVLQLINSLCLIDIWCTLFLNSRAPCVCSHLSSFFAISFCFKTLYCFIILQHGGGKVFKSLQRLVQSLKNKTTTVGLILVENESNVSRHLKHCALENDIQTVASISTLNSYSKIRTIISLHLQNFHWHNWLSSAWASKNVIRCHFNGLRFIRTYVVASRTKNGPFV